MSSGSLNIIKLWMWLGLSSLLYFCCLLLAIPVLITTISSITLGAFLFYKGEKNIEKNNLIVIGIAAIGCYLLVDQSLELAEKHGLWDAWAIWNLHTVYLASPEDWKLLFNNSNGAHPDYPFALPGILAYFKHLLPRANYWVAAYGIHLLTTISIPVLIYTETYKKNIIIAGIALLLLCTNVHFVYIGVSQLADTLLSLFFLIALIALNNSRHNPKLILTAALFTGLCMWTKNEGIVFAGFILLFHLKQFFSKEHRKLSIIGLILPALILLLFKTLYSTPNDLLSEERRPIWELLSDTSRYSMIYQSFVGNLNLHFKSVQYAGILFLLLAIVRWKKIQWKQLVMVLCICLTLMSVYLISPHDLEWHLATSQDRLILQLLPAFVYVLAENFASVATVDLPKALLSKAELPL
ncbi:MAG: hypothetical protein R2800_02765 [Flavipsychrobacter sp.]